ncbi:aminotransferase class I/II-fold pyridoxal phosphate-dependent enzyme [Micromonospora olivasterospora]|uniref:Aminotransferase n=1 Tax=Micromonospora olivasterospora TaxID=1880 RepID=A0A562IIH7_MICOL|nr:aminotransferase class I/II-fold pyridoxal phosphate-dependent enzyme [Micromonospora olivasterospora]TWH70740.1 aspartate aminotransferase [Micromonospora olivasterospora]
MDTIDLATGVPDIGSPPSAAAAATEAINRGDTRYVGAAGIAPLREAVSRSLLEERGLSYEPSQIMVTAGAKLSVFCVLSALVGPGSAVVLPVPHYGGYRGQIERLGGRIVGLGTTPDTGYKLTRAQLRDALDDDTRVVLLNSPANPSGAVYSADELAGLADVVVNHSSATIVSDEIYARFVYDGRPAPSLGSLGPEVLARTVTIDGVSKAYGMTGWRVGYAAGPRAVIDVARRVHAGLCNCAPSISQWAAWGALTGAPRDHHDPRRHQELRDLSHAVVDRWRGIRTVRPSGAIYQLIELVPEELGIATGEEASFFESWTSRARVSVAHDNRFGAPVFGRLTFSVPRPELEEGLRRLSVALEQLADTNQLSARRGTAR